MEFGLPISIIKFLSLFFLSLFFPFSFFLSNNNTIIKIIFDTYENMTEGNYIGVCELSRAPAFRSLCPGYLSFLLFFSSLMSTNI